MKFTISRDPKHYIERYKVVGFDMPCCKEMNEMITLGAVSGYNKGAVSICPEYDYDSCEAITLSFCPACGVRVLVEEKKQDG